MDYEPIAMPKPEEFAVRLNLDDNARMRASFECVHGH